MNMVRLLAGIAVAATSFACAKSASKDSPQKVSVVCRWDSYDTNDESFLIDLTRRSAYWVNENQSLNVGDFNDGRIVMEGTKEKVLVDQSRWVQQVRLRFTVNRISGDFDVDWLTPAYPVARLGNARYGKVFTRGCEAAKAF